MNAEIPKASAMWSLKLQDVKDEKKRSYRPVVSFSTSYAGLCFCRPLRPLHTSLPQVFDHDGSFGVECHHCLEHCITSLCNYHFNELVICAAAAATCNTALF